MNRHISAASSVALLAALSKPLLAQAAPAQAPSLPPAPPAPAVSADAAPSTTPAVTPTADGALQKEVSSQRADIDEQDARIDALEKQLKALKVAEAPKAEPKKAAEVPAKASAADSPFKVSGYIQAQYEFHQDSEDQLQQGGVLLNQNRFLLRRTRLKLLRDWQYGGLMVELDANTVKGAAIGLQHAEVSLAYRNQDYSPLVQVTFGLFDNPFGREVTESPRDRPFMERSLASRGFFPAEPDLGLRISGQAAWFRYSVAVVNGQPLGDRTGFALQDPNAHKDVLGRVGVDATPSAALRVIGGVSVLNGMGFHPGTDATKNTVIWRDNISEDGLVTLPELNGVSGVAAQPAQNFKRWLLGADLGFDVRSKLGVTHLYGEVSLGSNMDRNLFIADPVTTGLDARELGWYLAAYHECSEGPIAGFRVDQYNPNSDVADARAGKLIPLTETVTTYAPLVGFQVPHKARLVAEWDIIHDAMARNTLGVPVDKKNNIVTIRLQGEL
ncbi:MAG TPA: porin [Polyangiaceae bacterium]